MRPLPGSPPVGKLSEMTEIDIVSAHMIHGAVEYQRRGTPDVHVLISNSQNVVDRFTTPRTSRPRRPNYRRNSAERNPGTSPVVIRHGLQLLEHTSDGGRCQAGSEREGRDKKWSVLSPVASTRTTWSRVLLRELLQTKYPACVQVG